MRIGIDMRPTQMQKQKFRGIGSYARNLIAALIETDRENEYFLYCDRNLPVSLDIEADNFHIESSTVKSQLLSSNPFVQRQFATAIDLNRRHYDIFHFLFSQDASMLSRQPYIVTVHDLISILFKDHYGHNLLRSYFDAAWIKAAKKARHIIAVSESTKLDLIQYAAIPEDQITVIYEGVSPEFFLPPESQRADELAELAGLPEKFFFYIGGLEKRKNLQTLFAALALLDKETRQTYPLVIAGEPDQWFDRTRSEIEQAGVSGSVIFTGFLSLEELIVAYRKASLFILPSLYEGFGLPVLEAMASHTPVICSTAGSLPEVAGDAAFYFDPNSPEELAAAIMKLLEDEQLANELTEKGHHRAHQFSWMKTAQETVKIYLEYARKPES